jgi:hypothetical protein
MHHISFFEREALYLMTSINISEYNENNTIKKQIDRGKGLSIDSDKFREGNRISIDITNIFNAPGDNVIKKDDIESIISDVATAHRMLLANKGDIMDNNIPMTGWVDLPVNISADHIERIKALVKKISPKIDAFVSLGIGGSYLGVEATIKALPHNHFNQLTRESR